MIIVYNKTGNIDQLLRSYKKAVDMVSLLKKFKSRIRYKKTSTKNREMLNKAIKTQRYKVEHNLV